MSKAALTNRIPVDRPQSGGSGTNLLSQPVIICLCLCLLTLLVYWPVRNYDFIGLDDQQYVTNNPQVQQGLTMEGVAWAMSNREAANWHPLTWLSHMVDVTLFGPGAAGPHLVNLLFHMFNTVLLFLVLRKLTSAYWKSALVAALFSLHPLHVESVTWVAERKDVLSTFFFLLSIWAYAQYVDKSKSQKPKAKIFFASAILLFALGLMSKPMLVTLPFVLLLLDFWPLERFQKSSFRSLVLEKTPFFFLTALSCAVTIWAQQTALSSLERLPLYLRVENVFVAYARYLGKTLWPVNLALPYPYQSHWHVAAVLLSAILIVALCALALNLRRKLPFLFTGLFWFLGTLVPVIGLVQVGNQSMADRYTYIPLIGVFIALVWTAALAFSKRPVSVAMIGVAAAIVLGASAIRSREQLSYWQNSGTLFRHSVAVTEDNSTAYYGLAYYLAGNGQLSEAIQNYRHAVQIDPTLWGLQANFADALAEAGQIEEAMQYYTNALQLSPTDPVAHCGIANTLANQGRTDEAIEHYRLALHYRPKFAEAENNFGVLLLKLKRTDEAIQHFRAVIQYQPTHASAHGNLGNALATQGNWTESATQYAEAVRLTPDSPEAHFGLAIALARIGQRVEAIAQVKETLQLRPDMPGAKQFLQTLEATPKP